MSKCEVKEIFRILDTLFVDEINKLLKTVGDVGEKFKEKEFGIVSQEKKDKAIEKLVSSIKKIEKMLNQEEYKGIFIEGDFLEQEDNDE